MNLEEMLLPGGLAALGVAFVAIVAATVGAIGSAVRWTRERRWNRAQEEHMIEVIDTAERIDAVVEDLLELDRKVHYRHNVHCPACGRFARQAEGFPAGVADCGLHGIGIHVRERGMELTMHEIPIVDVVPVVEIEVMTGAIPLVIEEIRIDADIVEFLTEPFDLIPELEEISTK